MKRNVIITGVAVLAISTGIITYMNVNANEKVATVANQSRVESVQVPENKVEETPTASEAPQAPQVVATDSTPTSAPTAPSEPQYFDKSKLFEYSMVRMSTTMANSPVKMKMAPITGAIVENYDSHKELFTVSLVDSTIDKCVAYYESLSPQDVQIALSKNDCGL